MASAPVSNRAIYASVSLRTSQADRIRLRSLLYDLSLLGLG